MPTENPTVSPSSAPTGTPTSMPTDVPTALPTVSPTISPTGNPTSAPTSAPTTSPTLAPTLSPTENPTTAQTYESFTNLRTRGWGDQPATFTIANTVKVSKIRFTHVSGGIRGTTSKVYWGSFGNYAELVMTSSSSMLPIAPTSLNTLGFTKLNMNWGYFYTLDNFSDVGEYALEWDFSTPLELEPGMYKIWIGEDWCHNPSPGNPYCSQNSEGDNTSMDLTFDMVMT